MRDTSRRATRRVTGLLAASALALAGSLVGLVTTPVSAAVTSWAYTLDVGDPVLTTVLGADSQGPCVAGAATGTYRYETMRFRVSVSDSYVVTDTSVSTDARVGIYTGTFDPAQPTTGCVAFVDADETVALTAGTVYTLVQSTSTDGATGSFAVSLDGDGTATVVTASTTTLTSSPNPSRLSKAATLEATVAGGTSTPTGTVQFREGATVLGSATVVGGVARLRTTKLGVGSHTVTAVYSGDAGHDPSSDTHVHRVKHGPKPKARLGVSDVRVSVGDKVRLTWVTTRATSVKALGAWRGKLPKKGSRTVKVKDLGVHVYKVRATNVDGKAVAKVKVTATRAPKKFTVTVPDDALTADTRVRVRASGLDGKERFKVFLDKELLVKGFADRRGRVSTLVRIPKDTRDGEHTLMVMGSNDTRSGEVDVLVVGPKQLDVEVAKQKVRTGRTNTVEVGGLVAGEELTITYNGKVIVESAVADAGGEFSFTFPVGEDLGIGTVEVVGAVPARNGEATFEVIPDVGRSA